MSHPDVIAGNGTIGLEIVEELPHVRAVVVPFGGGGLSCGIAAAVRALRPEVPVFAAEVETAAPLAASLAAGRPVEISHKRSFVDGIGAASLLHEMWPLARSSLAGSRVVPIANVCTAIRLLASRARVVAEGAGGAALAAALEGLPGAGDGPVVAVVSGGNIDAGVLATILEGQDSLKRRARLFGTPHPLRTYLPVMTSQTKRRIGFLIGFALYFGVIWFAWDTPLVYPLKVFVVLLHEISHGIAALATGGTIQGIELNPAQGGACHCPGGNALVTLSAGYLGSLGWGALLLMGARTGPRASRWIVAAVGVMVVVLTLLYVRTAFRIRIRPAVRPGSLRLRRAPAGPGQPDPADHAGAHQLPVRHPRHQERHHRPARASVRCPHAGRGHGHPHHVLGVPVDRDRDRGVPDPLPQGIQGRLDEPAAYRCRIHPVLRWALHA